MIKRMFFSMLIVLMASCAGMAQPSSNIILEDGKYFNGLAFIPFKEMIIKEGKISAISNSTTRETGQRVPLKGSYVIPGLIDAHQHITGSPAFPYVMADAADNLKSNLHCGITTVVDLFYPEAGVKDLRESVVPKPNEYASILMSGPILTAPGGHGTEYGVPTRTMTTVEEAHTITNEVIDNGVDVIKVVYQAYTNKHTISKPMLEEIVRIAHQRGKKVFVHIDDAAEAMDCIDAKADVLAHMPVDKMSSEQLSKLKKSGIAVIPTITVYQSVFEGHGAAYASDSLLWRTANPAYMENFDRGAIARMPIPENMLRQMFHITDSSGYRENLRNCIKMNIPIIAGTDAGNYAVFFGYSLHNEIAQYVHGGMTNAQALCAATENLGKVLPGIKTGKITEGYDADVVVLGSDPLKDISSTKDIKMVIHKGKWIDMSASIFKQQRNDIATNAFDPSVFSLNNMTALPAYITDYIDNVIGGKSELKMELRKDAAGGNSLHLAGKVVKSGYMGFAGASFILSKQPERNPAPVDIGRYKSIQFDVKGNGETYYLMAHLALVKDYNYHTASFATGSEWRTITIPFAGLKQNTHYGKQMALDPKYIQAFTFIATGKDYPIDLDIKNIRLVE